MIRTGRCTHNNTQTRTHHTHGLARKQPMHIHTHLSINLIASSNAHVGTCTGEEGVDAGGLTKELFALLIERLFDAQYGMFVHSEETR
jgi:hypothetical protein